ncbi:Mitochondrial oxaloacetate carrier protein [Puccinia graminis f. sp. tritici]|uniref:Mitochondrial oxaloacetate carrier protein n=1 Tax=Puccinia graminis f. sp. tritici TaxID=56615 RepID=A0A5B0Q7M2_PUCGR|nr:Mitochondrial oxaloacetate carrier protein [Puccinia graminis f. sp. tritici]KAA1109220.1 Mitochondrial oxaloacetate carrier protein [Puccinia graminis f. sp. tritici]
MPAASSHQLSTLEGFASGALGACVAVTFTNPMEVAKTRLQLDGELRSKGSPKAYTNTFDVLTKTAKSEGLRACQKGLGAAYTYQFALNGSRLGFYEPLRRSIGSLSGQDPSRVQLWSSVSAGALSGVIGAILGNPLFLVKARMQAYSSVRDSSAGKLMAASKAGSMCSSTKPSLSPHPTQHAYKSALDGLHQIFKAEGFKGLMRGVDAAMMRTAMGSSVQLPAYNYAKTNLAPYFSPDSFWLYIASSSFSGLCVLTAMQPADTALTRMYNQSNQPGKRLYKNPVDCLWKTVQIEGFTGLYKGSTAHFFRIAPHTIITLVANEAISQWWCTKMSR